MKRIVFTTVFVVLLSISSHLAAQVPDNSSADMELRLQKLQEQLNQLELQSEKLQSKSEQGQKPTVTFGGTLEQNFESNNSSWTIIQGQTLDLKLTATPLSNVIAHADLKFLGKVAPDILHYSYLPILANRNILFVLREADVALDTDLLSFRAFTGQGHAGWHDTDDDFFYLFPEQWDLDKYFRVSGRALPTGMEVKGKKDLEGLDVWVGQELQWGVSGEIYVKYKHDIGPTTLGVIDRVSLYSFFINPLSTTIYAPSLPTSILASPSYVQHPQNSAEVFWKVPIPDLFTLDAVVYYNPANANQPYTKVDKVAPGTGTLGTDYLLYRGMTNNAGDALGYQVKLTTRNIPFIDSLTLTGEHSGIIAGNLNRLSGEITEVPAPFCLFTLNGTVQKPLMGPNPLVYYGSPGNSLGTLVSPRSQFDPFRVTTDPISGINNRELTQFSLSFVFNNGNGWFFRYNPNNFGLWNVNTDLDTEFSTGIIGSIFNYPTGTDLSSFIDASGTLVWEPSGTLGQPATNGYLPAGAWVTMWRAGKVHFIVDLEGGYSMASLSQGVAVRSSVNSLQGSLATRIDDTTVTLGYGRDVWGPEDWHRQFGLSIGQAFLAQIVQKFGASEVSVKYERWDNLPGDPYQSTPGQLVGGITLPIDEIYTTYKLNF